MKPYFESERGKLYHGDCLEVMKTFLDNAIDCMLTDPPYGLSFMGKKWDYSVPSVEVWKECLRVLKPGAHALIFAGSRTQHRMAVNVEDAGFILKDCLMWIYGSGFPKSTDIRKQIDKMAGTPQVTTYVPNFKNNDYGKGKGGGVSCDNSPNTPEAELWNGWGTHLKPSFEPILLAMKPNEKTYAQNALKHGVAGLNIDGGRIETEESLSFGSRELGDGVKYGKCIPSTEGKQNLKGRFPANIIFDEEAARLLDEQRGESKSVMGKRGLQGRHDVSSPETQNIKLYTNGVRGHQDFGGASRFFYCAKASKSERGEGNNHPTVKPLKLIEYLCNLLKTPTGGIVLDPFAGSGSTALACESTQQNWTLIEKSEKYCEIAAKRIEAVTSQKRFDDYL